MSPANVVEPTYAAIRGRLMIGAWPMGFRLEAARLADELGVSITPVRDSLNRLVGERLVDLVPGMGFHVPHMTEKRFRDLLDLHLVLLLSAVERRAGRDDMVMSDLPPENHAQRTRLLFTRLAAYSGNDEIVSAVQMIDARLHVTRVHEVKVLSGVAEEIDALDRVTMTQGGLHGVGTLLRRYSSLRKRKAARIIALV